MDITIPAPPTAVGQQVRAVGYGRNVTLDMTTGIVVRFTRTGVPVIAADPVPSAGFPGRTVSDPDGCFALVDADGRIIRTTVA
jgi:hypothetical protein